MDKTFNMLVQETKQKIMNDISESKLPAVVTQMMINEIKQMVDIQAQQILVQETQIYNEELAKQELKENDNKNENVKCQSDNK